MLTEDSGDCVAGPELYQLTAWKQEMLQSGFPPFSSVRAHVCLLHDLLLRGALWDTVVKSSLPEILRQP